MYERGFRSRVIAAVRRIPPGRVATYGDVADMAGSPRAWRAVGNIMRECRDPGTPCHRVIGAGGALGGYGGGNLPMKRQLLRAEGVEVGVGRIRRFRDVHWSSAVRGGASTGTRGSSRSPAPPRTRGR